MPTKLEILRARKSINGEAVAIGVALDNPILRHDGLSLRARNKPRTRRLIKAGLHPVGINAFGEQQNVTGKLYIARALADFSGTPRW